MSLRFEHPHQTSGKKEFGQIHFEVIFVMFQTSDKDRDEYRCNLSASQPRGDLCSWLNGAGMLTAGWGGAELGRGRGKVSDPPTPSPPSPPPADAVFVVLLIVSLSARHESLLYINSPSLPFEPLISFWGPSLHPHTHPPLWPNVSSNPLL